MVVAVGFRMRPQNDGLVGRRFDQISYHWKSGYYLPPAHTGTTEFHADGKVEMSRYVQGKGTWRQEGDEIVVEFTELDGHPAAELEARWPKIVKAAWAAEKKHSGPSSPMLKSILASPYPYREPWRFRIGHRIWGDAGPAFEMKQISGDPIADMVYYDRDFR